MEETYFPINRETVQIEAIRSFDIYFKDDDRMVIYSSGGEEPSPDVEEEVQAKNADSLYIRKRDISYYNLYIEEVLSSLMADPRISPPVKAQSAYNAVLFVARSLFKTPTGELIKRYRNTVFEMVDFLYSKEGAFHLLTNLSTFDYSLFNHNVNVGIFATGLMQALLGEEAAFDRREAAIGFFLHDLGMITIPVDVLNKKGPLSPMDWRLVKRHPDAGHTLLRDMKATNDEASLVVLQHHERHDGSGYPKGLRGNKIHVLSKICSIADSFDSLTSRRPYRQELTTFNALKIMKVEMFKHFDPAFFQKFVMLLSDH